MCLREAEKVLAVLRGGDERVSEVGQTKAFTRRPDKHYVQQDHPFAVTLKTDDCGHRTVELRLGEDPYNAVARIHLEENNARGLIGLIQAALSVPPEKR